MDALDVGKVELAFSFKEIHANQIFSDRITCNWIEIFIRSYQYNQLGTNISIPDNTTSILFSIDCCMSNIPRKRKFENSKRYIDSIPAL